jgi:hypothetical protein
MTAFALDFRRDRATVQCDTLAYIPHRTEVIPLGFSSKVIALPHLNAVLFGRGQMEIIVRVACELLLRPDTIGTLEKAAKRLPDKLANCTDGYAKQHGFQAEGAGVLECILLGYSKTEKRMRFWQYLSTEDYEPQDDAGQFYGVLSMPRLPVMPKLPANPSAKELSRVIHACGKYFAAHPDINCGMRLGGEIVQHVITPAGISSKIIHRFADYEEMRVASAAICNRIEDGRMDVTNAVADGLVPRDQLVDTATGKRLYAA